MSCCAPFILMMMTTQKIDLRPDTHAETMRSGGRRVRLSASNIDENPLVAKQGGRNARRRLTTRHSVGFPSIDKLSRVRHPCRRELTRTNSRISKWLRRAAVLAPPIVLAACALPYATPVFNSSTSRPAEKIAFRGVIDELSYKGPLDVLLVHGMCTHDGKWANNAARTLYDKIGGGSDVVSLVRTIVPDTDIELFQQTLSTRFGALRVNAIVWSAMTVPLKQQLCYDQTLRIDPKENANAYCLSPEQTKPYLYDRSASLNRMLKDVILDDCLSDALAYQGRSRDEMSARMQRAILQALAMSGNTPVTGPDMRAKASTLEGATSPLIIIADSLGSKVAFDALWRMRAESATNRAIERTLQRTTQVFMRANQLTVGRNTRRHRETDCRSACEITRCRPNGRHASLVTP